MHFHGLILSIILFFSGIAHSLAQDITCWFAPGSDSAKSKSITDALTKESGLNIIPRVANSYPELMKGFAESKPSLAYVGSFASAIIKARNLGTPIVQKIDGKEFYSGIMVFPKGEDPAKILKENANNIAFAQGATSGESSAKAATSGKASVAVKDHMAACNAVKVGKAKAAFVKNFWWDGNKDKFANFDSYAVPGVSEQKNPDNILWASKAISSEQKNKLVAASKNAKDAFGAKELKDFDPSTLSFTLGLMKNGNIDANQYSW